MKFYYYLGRLLFKEFKYFELHTGIMTESYGPTILLSLSSITYLASHSSLASLPILKRVISSYFYFTLVLSFSKEIRGYDIRVCSSFTISVAYLFKFIL